MSFFKSLFGRSGKPEAGGSAKPVKSLEHKGYQIAAMPYLDGGQYQTAGVISKEIEGVRREHRFVRADRFTSAPEAADHALNKGCQIIDERGDRIFD